METDFGETCGESSLMRFFKKDAGNFVIWVIKSALELIWIKQKKDKIDLNWSKNTQNESKMTKKWVFMKL